jgi:hypothetical protein
VLTFPVQVLPPSGRQICATLLTMNQPSITALQPDPSAQVEHPSPQVKQSELFRYQLFAVSHLVQVVAFEQA